MKIPGVFMALVLMTQCSSHKDKIENIPWSDNIQVILDNTKPLQYNHGTRLPLYLWPAIDPG
jgi:hypothetical protein